MKKGFTLIEMLVVIGIIAILTAITLPSFNNFRKKNRDTERIADISAIQLALSLYHSQNPTLGYPKTLATPDFQSYVTADDLIGPNGESYQYVSLTKATVVTANTKCTSYHLGTILELSNEVINTVDTFTSSVGSISDGYVYCDVDTISSTVNSFDPLAYDVHP